MTFERHTKPSRSMTYYKMNIDQRTLPEIFGTHQSSINHHVCFVDIKKKIKKNHRSIFAHVLIYKTIKYCKSMLLTNRLIEVR
jgi:hypothetical protein